ncbi:MAG: helix-turn-helix domain-containing protein [Verrucomicrobia bacterium]|nr:helix-turn-helix domain-containing protein [Prolixibacteraceae bacterium]
MRKELTEFCYFLEKKEKIKLSDRDQLVDEYLKLIRFKELLYDQFSPSSFYKSINNSMYVLEKLISTSVDVGIKNYLISVGAEREYLSQAATYRKYGRKTIERWRRDGKIIPVKQNGTIKYKISTLEKLSMANELFGKFIESH